MYPVRGITVPLHWQDYKVNADRLEAAAAAAVVVVSIGNSWYLVRVDIFLQGHQAGHVSLLKIRVVSVEDLRLGVGKIKWDVGTNQGYDEIVRQLHKISFQHDILHFNGTVAYHPLRWNKELSQQELDRQSERDWRLISISVMGARPAKYTYFTVFYSISESQNFTLKSTTASNAADNNNLKGN